MSALTGVLIALVVVGAVAYTLAEAFGSLLAGLAGAR